eukprot:6188341-Pleurochrysis_carterae.AAC.2
MRVGERAVGREDFGWGRGFRLGWLVEVAGLEECGAGRLRCVDRANGRRAPETSMRPFATMRTMTMRSTQCACVSSVCVRVREQRACACA